MIISGIQRVLLRKYGKISLFRLVFNIEHINKEEGLDCRRGGQISTNKTGNLHNFDFGTKINSSNFNICLSIHKGIWFELRLKNILI